MTSLSHCRQTLGEYDQWHPIKMDPFEGRSLVDFVAQQNPIRMNFTLLHTLEHIEFWLQIASNGIAMNSQIKQKYYAQHYITYDYHPPDRKRQFPVGVACTNQLHASIDEY